MLTTPRVALVQRYAAKLEPHPSSVRRAFGNQQRRRQEALKLSVAEMVAIHQQW